MRGGGRRGRREKRNQIVWFNQWNQVKHGQICQSS